MVRRVWRRSSAFTIVELIVVISIIGVLTSIGVLSYGAWRDNTVATQVKNDLNTASQSLESERSLSNSGYPSTFPSSLTISQGVQLTLSAVDSTSYCIDGVSATNSSIQYYIDSTITQAGPKAGTCAGRTVTTAPATPTSFAMTSATNSQIALQWTAATGPTFTVQCATDGAFIAGLKQATTTTNAVTVSGLSVNTTYYCRVKASNTIGDSAWSSTITTQTVISFGVVNAAMNLRETVNGATQSTHAWDSITCSLGTAYYRFVWVSPTTTAEAWATTTSVTNNNTQGLASSWKVQTKCVYLTNESTVTDSATRNFTPIVADPSGSWNIAWNDRFIFTDSGYSCTAPATKQVRLQATLLNYTSGTWDYGWNSSSSGTVNNANQGSRMTTYMQVRCTNEGNYSNTLTSSSRTDNASVDAPGYVPGWCAGTCGSPRGDRWSAVGCPAGTYAVYWAHSAGDYGNAIWGPHEAANFYGYDRGYYNYGNTMVNGYLMARCTSDFRSSAWGPQAYARY